MSNFKFSIPLQLKDLANVSGKGEYCVENEYSVRDLKLKLNVSQSYIPFYAFFLRSIIKTKYI